MRILNVMAHVNTDTVVIRRAVADDLDALRYLAALDSARALLGDVLVAESDGSSAPPTRSTSSARSPTRSSPPPLS